nr:uncharacterized protein LOC102084086 [Columba livia]
MGPVAHLVTLHRGRVLCHLHCDLGQRNTPLPPPTSVCFKGLNRQVLIFEATDPLSTCSALRTPELSDAWSRPKPLPGTGTKGTPPPELQSQGDCDRHRPCFHDHLDRQQLHPAQPPPAVCGPPRAEQRGRATPPRPTGNTLSNAAQETVCCLCHKGMLLAQAQLGVHQVPPKVLFRQAAPQLSQHVLVPGVVPPQVQDSTLPFLNYSQGRRANKQYKKTTLSSFLFKNLLFCFGLCIV